jgi:hypothetical protein
MKFSFFSTSKALENEFGIKSKEMLIEVNKRIAEIKIRADSRNHSQFLNELYNKYPKWFTQNQLYIRLLQCFTEIEFNCEVENLKFYFNECKTTRRFLFPAFDHALRALEFRTSAF